MNRTLYALLFALALLVVALATAGCGNPVAPSRPWCGTPGIDNGPDRC